MQDSDSATMVQGTEASPITKRQKTQSEVNEMRMLPCMSGVIDTSHESGAGFQT